MPKVSAGAFLNISNFILIFYELLSRFSKDLIRVIKNYFLTFLLLSISRWTHLNESIRSGMAVLDVTIPTGYWIQQQKLDAYILSKRVRNLQRARFVNNKVLFYFDYVSAHFTFNNPDRSEYAQSYIQM